MPQYCLVKHHIVSSVIDGPDVGNDPDILPVSGDVTFYPILDRGDSVVVTTGAGKVSHILDPISARIVKGKISVNGEEGVKLFAGGPDTNPERIRYRAKFTDLNIAGVKRLNLKDILFEAVPGGEMELSVAQPTPGKPYPGYSPTIEAGITAIENARNGTLAAIDSSRDDALGSVGDAVDVAIGTRLDTKADITYVDDAVNADKWTNSSPAEWEHSTSDGYRLPLGYSADGRLDDHARKIWAEDVSGVYKVGDDGRHVHVYTTPDGHVLASILSDGTVHIPRLSTTGGALTPPSQGSGVGLREKYRHTDGALAPVLADTTRIVGWGSSSMEGMTSELRIALDGLPTAYENYAKGGELIQHNAARMGAIPAIIEPVTIPASGPVTVTSENMPANANMRAFTGHLGEVHGTLSYSEGDSVFTRSEPGDPVSLSAPTPFIPDLDPGVLEATTLLQLGKNNFNTSTASVVIPQTKEILAYLRPLMPRVLILGHHVNTGWSHPNLTYLHTRTAEINAEMRRIAGDDCFIDIQGIITGTDIWDRTGLTPTADDLLARSEGRMPPSLNRDSAHFNNTTDQAIADIIRERIDYLGWY